MNRKQLREAARTRLDDWAQPYGWSDAELNTWLSEAVREASLRAGLNVESVFLSVRALRAVTTLPLTIYYVHEAWWWPAGLVAESAKRPLRRSRRQSLDLSPTELQIFAAAPTHFMIEGRKLRVYPAPATDGRIEFIASVCPPALESESDEPAMNPAVHEHLIEWIIYRAGQKRDVDFNLPNPEQYEVNFTRIFGPRPSERTQQVWREAGSTDTVSPLAWHYAAPWR